MRNIRLWFDEIVVPYIINPVLKENSCRIIDDNNKYLFYFYYLLQMFSTYHGELLKNDVLVCVDEFQDLSPKEIDLIKEINKKCTINLYGDLNQRLLSKWFHDLNDLPKDCQKYYLNNNYRNTLEITKYYNGKLNKKDNPVGINGPQISTIKYFEVNNSIFNDQCVLICSSKKLKK